MKTKILIIIICLTLSINGISQYPWNNPLKIACSTDGVSFNNSAVFQDSAGVPSVIRWKGDTLIAAFQWFRMPNPSPSWDRVATKISCDNGISWSQPVPINLTGLPVNFQRPFDPTLCVFNNDSLRIYFSSSNGMPLASDSIIDTYSAKSADGINFYFEPYARVNEANNRVIDPAVINFYNSWHYISPVGSPQQGAYHYISPDGLNFTKVPDIVSDNSHNWTGNYMIESSSEVRFYGSGQYIWYNSSPNGGVWNNYINTNIHGGDPSVLKISNNNYLMIYVGQPYNIGINDIENEIPFTVYPNPCSDNINIIVDKKHIGSDCQVMNISGQVLINMYICSENMILELNHLPAGIYLLRIGESFKKLFKIIKN